MCLVQTPYYHDCGHYGTPVVARYGRCARAEGVPGACWEAKPIGIKTVEAVCGCCTRMAKDALIKANYSGTGPVDINKFNELVKLHKKTCDRRDCSDVPYDPYDLLTPETVQVKSATLLMPHPTPSYRTQKDWLHADRLPPAQSPWHPLRPAPCRPKVGHRSSSLNNLIAPLSSVLRLGTAPPSKRIMVRRPRATSTYHPNHNSYTTPFESHGYIYEQKTGSVSLAWCSLSGMNFCIATGGV